MGHASHSSIVLKTGSGQLTSNYLSGFAHRVLRHF
jgi:hypothetical protein